jgi:hypothetical protein
MKKRNFESLAAFDSISFSKEMMLCVTGGACGTKGKFVKSHGTYYTV